MRAEKRKKNAPKELERLKSLLRADADAVMEEVKEVAAVLPPAELRQQQGEMGTTGTRGTATARPPQPPPPRLLPRLL